MAAQLDAAQKGHDGPLADAVARQQLVKAVNRRGGGPVEGKEDVALQDARPGSRAVGLNAHDQDTRLLRKPVVVDELP